MKPLLSIALIAIAVATCNKRQATPSGTPASPGSSAEATAAPTAGATEKTYVMNGKLVSRDATKNEVTIDSEEVAGGVMAAMVMAYELRGADVGALPADGTRITVTLHEQDGKYWVTDMKPLQ